MNPINNPFLTFPSVKQSKDINPQKQHPKRKNHEQYAKRELYLFKAAKTKVMSSSSWDVAKIMIAPFAEMRPDRPDRKSSVSWTKKDD